MVSAMPRLCRLLPILACLLVCAAQGISAEAERAGEALLDTAGVQGGLVVHLGCGDGTLTAALRADDRYLVHGLDADPKNVAAAREHIASLGLSGAVSVETFDGERLPYVDNLVNLLVAEDLGRVPMAEVRRALAPRGVAIIGGEKTVKPWPADIDHWTHYLHGPDNNALAEDRVVGPPRHMQWLAGPKWTRHHHASKGGNPSIRAVVSARGRLYYMVDEAGTSNMSVPGRWMLAARDGFSGVLLWKKPIQVPGRERRLDLVWRTLVADGDRVYAPLGPDQPLAAFDAATGAVRHTYNGTDGLREMVKERNALFLVTRENGLLALRSDSGETLWRWEPEGEGAIVPLTLAASGKRLFVKTERAALCLAANDGKLLWRTPLEGPEKKTKLRFPRERLIVSDGVVLCSHGGKDPKSIVRDRFQYTGSHPRVHEYDGKLAALSARDGRVLWRGPYLPGLESPPGEIYVSDGVVWLGPDFAQPRDLRTGKVQRTRPVIERLWTTGHHYRCYPGKATSRYIITAKRGIEMIDLHGENHSRNNWVRGTCRVGVTPCNGLLYAPPHSCGCYMEAKLTGFWALASASARTAVERRAPPRLERGPAYGQTPEAEPARADAGWPTYRGDAQRSNATASSVPSKLKLQWATQVDGPLSAVTAAGGRVLVAQVDAHTVQALDAAAGEVIWRFTAGGRVDSPPTLHAGLALFGCRDGWVYCLRAADGALAWRFRAAPADTRAVAYERLESVWPIHGSVLVHEGTAYVAAGRSSYLDGGITLYGLDPETGAVRCTTRLASKHPRALDPPPEDQRRKMANRFAQNSTDYKTFLAPDRSDAFSMCGARTDVMSAADGSIFLRHLRFDRGLEQQEGKLPHLFSTTSLLDGAEHHRSYQVFGTGDFSRTPVAFPWIIRRKLAVPYGLMLAFDRKTVWGVHRVGRHERTDHYAVFAVRRPDPSDEASRLPDFAKRRGKRPNPLWTVRLPFRPRAMICAGDALIIGGTARGKKARGGVLRMLSRKDGKTIGQETLTAAPVWDGLAVSDGRLFISLEGGAVQCWH